MFTNLELILLTIVLVFLIIYDYFEQRGYFWKDKQGNKLSFKEFMSRWKSGVVDITPVQQTRTILWSFLPIFAGMLWGIVITFIGKVYWLTLILLGSFPITLVQFIGNFQKYKAQKAAEKAYKEVMESGK